jgi:tetratricopeptide (TPR) repeat protein
MRLAPVYPSFYPAVLASAYFMHRQYREAVSSAEKVLALKSDNIDALLILAGAHAALGNDAEARSAALEVRSVKPDFSLEQYAATQPYHDTALLEHLLENLRRAGLH